MSSTFNLTDPYLRFDKLNSSLLTSGKSLLKSGQLLSAPFMAITLSNDVRAREIWGGTLSPTRVIPTLIPPG